MTAATVAPAPPRPARSEGVTQARVVRSEWVKLTTLRSTWFTLAAAVAAMVVVGCLISWGTASHWDRMSIGERLTFDPVTRSLDGAFLAQLAIGVLGVLVITGEYATGMIRATLSAVPTRLPVLWAKLGVYAAGAFVVMLASAFVAFAAGQALLGSHGTTLSAPHALRAVFGVALYLTVVGLLGTALGFVVRSTAGGIAALVGLLMVLPLITRALPSNWQDAVLPYLPSQAGSALFTVRPEDHMLAPWTGFGVFCAWAAAAVVAAVVLLRRRDA